MTSSPQCGRLVNDEPKFIPVEAPRGHPAGLFQAHDAGRHDFDYTSPGVFKIV